MNHPKWKPESVEDKILLAYWKEFKGLILTEVVVGVDEAWEKGVRPRRIDGIRIENTGRNEIVAYTKEHKQVILNAKSKDIEIIEVKRKLNRLLLGQVIIGSDLIEHEYNKEKIQQVALFQEYQPDAALKYICQKRGIKLWSQKEGTIT